MTLHVIRSQEDIELNATNHFLLLLAALLATTCLVPDAQGETTYTFVIDQEHSEVYKHMPNIGHRGETTHRITGMFDLVVDREAEEYYDPIAYMRVRDIEVLPAPDPDFIFPQYLLRWDIEEGSPVETFAASGDPCNDFNWRRDRGGTCWSYPTYFHFGYISGSFDGSKLTFNGTQDLGLEESGPGTVASTNYVFNISANLIEPITGDFDSDFDVDGADFLAWQRGESPHPHSSSDFNAWQANYGADGANLAAEAAAVPEPWSGGLLFVGVMVLTMGYRNFRSATLC